MKTTLVESSVYQTKNTEHNENMEPEYEGWQNEMRKYIRSVEDLTVNALQRIKRDLIRNDLPFDVAFQKYFLQKTNARIADVYTDFLFGERLESEQSAFDQDVNQRNENGNANILEMPIILEQLNNQNACAQFSRKDNGMSEPIVISIPSNELSIPSQMDFNENSAQKTRGSSENKLLNVSNPNKQIAVSGDRLAIELTSTGADNLEFNKPLDRMVNSDINQRDAIDLISDHAETNGVLNPVQNDSAIVLFQGSCRTKANKNDAHMKNQVIISKRPRMEMDEHASGQNVSQHSDNSTTNDAVAADNNDDLELATENGVATVPDANDIQQFAPIASSNIKIEFSSNKTTIRSQAACAFDHETLNQRLNLAVANQEIPSPQYPESIDLVSDDEDARSQAVNNFSNDTQNAIQPTIRGRKSGADGAIASGHLKKKNKMAEKCAINQRKRHKCDVCEYSTNKKWHLNYHIRTHTNERPYRCEVCDKQFTQQQNLSVHMKTHRDMFAFQCSNCHRGFADKQLCTSHESRCNAKGYECHLCKKSVNHKQHLVEHMRKHTGEKLHCPKCQRQFGFNSGLVRHMKIHGKSFRFECSNCRHGFSHKAPWKLHESRCKSKQSECFLCSKKFHQQKCNLLVHMRHKYTGEKPFECSDCPMRFKPLTSDEFCGVSIRV